VARAQRAFRDPLLPRPAKRGNAKPLLVSAGCLQVLAALPVLCLSLLPALLKAISHLLPPLPPKLPVINQQPTASPIFGKDIHLILFSSSALLRNI
jgi:hypothetical protein